MPHQLDGVRIDPPWSPPSAIGTSPAATSAALPPDEPPALCAGLCGLRITPLAQVWLAPEKQRSSQAALPAMVPPASRIRVTTVAARAENLPSRDAEPFITATPATQILSLIAIFRARRDRCRGRPCAGGGSRRRTDYPMPKAG